MLFFITQFLSAHRRISLCARKLIHTSSHRRGLLAMEQPQKKSMHLVEGPYIGIYASGHNGAVRLEITENNQVKFHEAEAHGSGSIWESANGKKFISLVFHHSAKETIQQLSDHLLTERFPGLFMDKWNDVFYVCPQFFAHTRKDTDTSFEKSRKVMANRLPCPRDRFRLPLFFPKLETEQEIDSSWILLQQYKKPELILFLKNNKVLWEGDQKIHMWIPSGHWSQYVNEKNKKTYFKVAFDTYGNDALAEPLIFKAQEIIDGIELWYSLINNYEIKAEKLDEAFDDHKFQLCCEKDYRSERRRILGTVWME